MTSYPNNSEEFALDALLSDWVEDNQLSPSQAEAIRLAVLQTPLTLEPLSYAWWSSLFEKTRPPQYAYSPSTNSLGFPTRFLAFLPVSGYHGRTNCKKAM